MILTPDDYEPGLLISIYARRPHLVNRRARHGHPPTLEIPAETESPDSKIPGGAPLRIIAKSLPYLACALIQPDGEESGPIMIDTRRVTLMRIDSDYVAALVSFGREQMARAASAEMARLQAELEEAGQHDQSDPSEDGGGDPPQPISPAIDPTAFRPDDDQRHQHDEPNEA